MRPTSDEVDSYVRATVAEIAEIPAEEVQGSDRLREDLGLDSVQNMEFLSRVTERFAIDPDLEQVMRLKTVAEVVRELLLSLEQPTGAV